MQGLWSIHDKVMAVGASHVLDCSAALKEPRRKILKLEYANISESIKVEDYGKAFETNDGVKLKSDVSTVASCSVAESNRLLEPKHKIFLSHSGAQKDFVEQLCIDLERCDRHPFFDKRRSSLPIGEEFPKLIFDAIRQCQVGVVILSEFFTKSKWPMLELVAMVKEKQTQAECGIKIIPVFYSISLEYYRQPETHKRWIEQWKTWAKSDLRINIEEWRMALKYLVSIKSLIKDEVMGELECREKIVEAICCSVLPEIKWDDSHVEGKLRLCKVIIQKLYEKRDGLIGGVCAMGLYGVGGIGKTTACNALCNELFPEFSGRVCHIEFGSMSKVESFREVLRRLTDTRHDILSLLRDERQCLELLKRNMKHPVFLCLDNMSDNQEPIRQATTYLKAGFAKGSVVLVTARSLADLMCLNAFIHENDCIRMPELEEAEARQIFLNHAFPNNHAGNLNLTNLELTSRCVQRCYYFKGDGTFHYHPLALQVLGELLGCVGYDSRLWEMHLQKIDMFDQESSGYDHPIFSILRTCYDALSREAQTLFMDILLFLPSSGWHGNWDFCDWLSMVYGLRVDKIVQRLEYLNKKSLLHIYNVGNGRSRIGVHDLWREFSIAETKVGKLRDQRWVYLAETCPKLGESSPSGRCWENLERMCFVNEGLVSLGGLNLDYFCNVTVLKLVGKFSLSNIAIDLGGLKHLKSLEVQISGCRKLPDIAKLTSLRVACFRGNDKVDTTTGLSSNLTNLRILDLAGCRALRSVPGVNELVALEVLNLGGCDRLEMLPNLGKLVNLRRLNIEGCDSMLRHVTNFDELIALEQLRRRYGNLAVADTRTFRNHSRRHRRSSMASAVTGSLSRHGKIRLF